jgi:hypothetical protein
MNSQMRKGHDVSCRARRKDTLSAEDLGILLQWVKLSHKLRQHQTVCYGDIDLFLLRNPDNPERDILMAEVEFRNLKGRPEGADG